MVLIVIVLIAFFATLLAKMGPAYLSYYQVRSVMERVVAKPDLQGAGARQVLSALSSQLNIDGIRTISTKDFKVQRENNEVLLVLDYQVQEHLGFNVDVLMHFHHQVPFPTAP